MSRNLVILSFLVLFGSYSSPAQEVDSRGVNPQCASDCGTHEKKRAVIPRGSKTKIETFNDLLKKTTETEGGPCLVDQKTIRQGALDVMNGTLTQLYHEQPVVLSANAVEDDEEFKKIFLGQWERVLKKVQAQTKALNPNSERASQFTDAADELSDTMDSLHDAVEVGMLPLPVNTSKTYDGQFVFTYGALSRYFYAGFSPVSVMASTDEKMASRDDHPLSPDFLDGMLALLDHDERHSYYMGNHRKRLGISNTERCLKVQKCFASLPDGESPLIRKTVYYLLHEDGTFVNEMLRKGKKPTPDPGSLFEFSVESVIKNKASGFALADLIGKTDDERKKICGELNYFHFSMKRKNELTRRHYLRGGKKLSDPELSEMESLEGLVESVSPSLARLFPKSSDDLLLSETKEKILEDQKLGFLGKLTQKCRAQGYKQLTSTSTQHLDASFKTWEQKGFHTAVENELKTRVAALRKIAAALSDVPACQGIQD